MGESERKAFKCRLPYLGAEDLPEEQRELLTRPINLHRALVNSAEGFRHYLAFAQWIRYGSTLDPRLRELAILQIGYLTSSEYEFSHHVKIGQDFGISDDDVLALILETQGEESGLPSLDRAVLRAAREMTDTLTIRDDTFGALKQGLSHEHLVDLVLIISFYNGVVLVLDALRVDLEPEYERYLKEFPLLQGVLERSPGRQPGHHRGASPLQSQLTLVA
jgi:alkylhydroperoxidase family enzyme